MNTIVYVLIELHLVYIFHSLLEYLANSVKRTVPPNNYNDPSVPFSPRKQKNKVKGKL